MIGYCRNKSLLFQIFQTKLYDDGIRKKKKKGTKPFANGESMTLIVLIRGNRISYEKERERDRKLFEYYQESG